VPGLGVLALRVASRALEGTTIWLQWIDDGYFELLTRNERKETITSRPSAPTATRPSRDAGLG
jgi:hypothetical protein